MISSNPFFRLGISKSPRFEHRRLVGICQVACLASNPDIGSGMVGGHIFNPLFCSDVVVSPEGVQDGAPVW